MFFELSTKGGCELPKVSGIFFELFLGRDDFYIHRILEGAGSLLVQVSIGLITTRRVSVLVNQRDMLCSVLI